MDMESEYTRKEEIEEEKVRSGCFFSCQSNHSTVASTCTSTL